MENAQATPNPDPPPVVPRPAFALWIYQRNLYWREVAEALTPYLPKGGTVHPETVRCYCLPFGHAGRRVPHEDILAAIVALTRGEITAGSFYPPHLQPVSAEPAEAGAAQ